jgi:Rrf2 family nitric oxide-sensitive transcriptional repressor
MQARNNLNAWIMRLTAYTDYSLRTLIFLAMSRDRLVTVQHIADAHSIAKNHLTKVVHELGTLGYITTIRGRNGGLRLGREPADINIGEVVRHTETDFYMASCFDPAALGCIYAPGCTLKGVIGKATAAFLEVLDAVTLEDTLAAERRKQGALADPAPGTLRKAVPLQFRPPRKTA